MALVSRILRYLRRLPHPSSGRRDREDHSRRSGQGDRRTDRNGRGGRGGVHFGKGTPCRTDIITHLACNCGGSDANSTYHQCLVSTSNSDQAFTALTLFDTGAYTSFVNREVAKWLERQRLGGQVDGVTGLGSSRHDIPTSTVGLAGTPQSSSIYGSVAFDLTLFNEVTKFDNLLRNIKASVIDSCIEVIIGLPDIRSYRLIHRIPSYFDTPDPSYLDPDTYHKGHTLENKPPSQRLSVLVLSSIQDSRPLQRIGALHQMRRTHSFRL